MRNRDDLAPTRFRPLNGGIANGDETLYPMRCGRGLARILRLLEALAVNWRRLDDRMQAIAAVEALVQAQECCHLLMTVPGIGPIISGAAVADGDRTILGRIPRAAMDTCAHCSLKPRT